MGSLFTRFGWCVPLAFAGISIWQLQFAGIHMDTARDWAQALAVAEGNAPRSGPDIDRLFNLSPLWFYLLSAPLLLGFDFHAVAIWLGALFATQYWWAYCLGERARPHSGFGALASCALTLPNWAAVWMAGTTHTTLVVPATLATLLALLRYHARPSLFRLGVLAITLVASLHAHPTTGMLVVFALSVIFKQKTGWRMKAVHLSLLFTLIALPILAFGAVSGLHSTFGADFSTLERLKSAPKVLQGAISGAASTQLAMIAKTSPAKILVPLSIVAWSAVTVFAIFGLVRLRGRFAAFACALLTLSLLTVAVASASRSFVTFYMVGVLAATLPLVCALGFASARVTTACAISVCAIGLHAAWAHALVSAAQHDGFEMNVARVLDLGRESAIAPWAMQPVWSANAAPALATFLCAHPHKSLHGPAVPGVDLVAEVLTHRQCPNVAPPTLGGADVPASSHVVGVPCVSAQSAQRTGNVCWHPATEIIHSTGFEVAPERRHPPRTHASATNEIVRLDFQFAANQYVVITHHRMEWARVDQWRAVTSENVSLVSGAPWWRLYYCVPNVKTGCWLTVDLRTNDPAALDVVRFSPRAL